MSEYPETSRRVVLRQAWPVILANASVPLLGLADTAIIGQTGDTEALGALALGTLVFNFLYWAFGFLRMSTTGFIARAQGAGDAGEMNAHVWRALLIAAALGLLLVAGQWLWQALAFHFLQASHAVEHTAKTYYAIRIWGAPATLGVFVISGVLIGLGKNRLLLLLQLSLNGLNITLDFVLAGWLGMGVQGIALGTLAAETMVCVAGLVGLIQYARQHTPSGQRLWSRDRVLDPSRLRLTLAANRDIMIRTLALLFAFAWFTNQSARFGDTQLAANFILLEMISFCAFFLDGFAFVAEEKVGHALGSNRRRAFYLAVRHTSELAVTTAAGLALTLLFTGHWLVALLTDIAPVQASAEVSLPWVALYVLLSVGAFQLDGIFIGATYGSAMRNASLASVALFIGLCTWLVRDYGNTGLWWSFIAYVAARALTLMFYFPKILPRQNQ